MSVFNALKKCIGENNFNEFKKLLEENPSSVHETDVDQWTLLHFAIALQCTKFTEILLKHGADIYAKTKEGNTCLHIAIIHHVPLDLLLCLQHVDTRGLDLLNSQDKTPLHISLIYRSRIVTDILLNAGARVSLVQDHYKNTKSFKHFLSKRYKTQSSALVVLGILRFRCKPVVCRDMRNEIGKRIWETRMDEKWSPQEGLVESNLESSKKKNKQ